MAAAAKIDGQDPSISSSAPPRIDGQDKVIATAQQIVKSLAIDKTAAEDMMRILSTFDHRFSSINVFPSAADNAEEEEYDDANLSVDAGDYDGGYGGADDGEADEVRLEIEARLDEADKVISRWDSLDSDSLLFESSPEEIGDYLFVVDDTISIVNNDEFDCYDDLREKAEILIQISMSRLEEEFRHLMIRNTVPLDAAGLHSSIRRLSLSFASDAGDNDNLDEEFDASTEAESSVDHSSHHHHHHRQESSSDERSERFVALSEDHRDIDLIRPEAVADLKDISDRMIRADYHKELCQVHSSVRREILDECLSVLGVDRMSIDEVQRIEWKTLDDKMRKWIQAVKVVVRVLLSGEHRLCDQIFSESEQLREECFVESTKGCVTQLLNFGDAIAIQRRSSEKLFRILDMYDALQEVKPNLDEMYVGDMGSSIIREAERILEWLGDAVRGTLAAFASAVKKETSRRPVLGGEIHPLTRYVMNYVKLLVDYSSSLESLLEDDGIDAEDVAEGEPNTRLGHRLRLLISYLESNLEDKSKLYEDIALQFIFLMNNRLYIVQKVKNSDLGKILGENWVRKHRGQIRQYHNSYLRASWTKALSFLKDDGLSGSGSANSVSKVALKERFKNFNLAFEDIYRTQTAWKVPDPQLREELQLSTSEKIIPAYRSFLGRFGSQLETARHAARYIRYTPEDLESYLLEFFEGSSGLSNHPRRRLSSS